VNINFFNVSSFEEDSDSVGVALYLGSSHFDHSCDPNASYTNVGIDQEFRLIKDIDDFTVDKVKNRQHLNILSIMKVH